MTLTEKQLKNLDKLATYLESLPKDYKHFDMDEYFTGNEVSKKDQVKYARKNGGLDQFNCGAVACAVGHGPSAGILFKKSELMYDDEWDSVTGEWTDVIIPCWSDYTRNFAEQHSNEWMWMFGPSWVNYDNTPRGAAARIRYVLDGNDLPKGIIEDGEPRKSYRRRYYKKYEV